MDLREKLQQIIDNKTKPQGSLGMLEEIALQIGLIQQTTKPEIRNPTIVVFAADHGLSDEGVSPFPKEVTKQMVMNFLKGGAAINVFCRQNNIRLRIVDAGVDADFEASEHLTIAKIRKSTRNTMKEAAMTIDECKVTLTRGADIVDVEYSKDCNIIGFGEMGIGNTSSAALLMSRFCNLPVSICAGRGTGHDDEGLKRKISILENVASMHNVSDDPMEILSTYGGYEIAMIAGGMLKAYDHKMIILVDGFITTAALLAAYHINKDVLNNCIFCHKSDEQGHARMLDFFKAKPLLDIDLRLGEGTGAAVALPVVRSAVSFLNEMASFEDARVSNIK